MTVERTFLIVKPDGVERGLVGEIIHRVERKGFIIERLEMIVMSQELARKHYGEHSEKPFFEPLIEYITRGPVVTAVISGHGCVGACRELIGATDPLKAAPGTIRGDYAVSIRENVSHGSDSLESAAREISLFFPEAG